MSVSLPCTMVSLSSRSWYLRHFCTVFPFVQSLLINGELRLMQQDDRNALPSFGHHKTGLRLSTLKVLLILLIQNIF